MCRTLRNRVVCVWLDGKRGVRSVENEEYGKCGVWKMRSMESAECGKGGVWKVRSVENAECVEMHKR